MASTAQLRRARQIVPREPHGLEARYRRMLLQGLRRTRVLIEEQVEKELAQQQLIEEAARADGLPDLLRAMAAYRRLVQRAVGNVERAKVREMGEQVAEFAAREADRRIVIAAGLDGGLQKGLLSLGLRGVEDLLDGWIRANVDLITSVSTKYIDQVEERVRDALRRGVATQDLRKQIEERFGVAKSRAELIARDQLGKLAGQVTQRRSEDAGASRYLWSTSGDERVRDSHRALDGLVFSWDAPPAVGHPGQDYQCRCQALPVFDDADAERLKQQARRIQLAEESFVTTGS